MQENKPQAEERRFSYYLRPLGKHTLLILLFVLLALVGSLAYSFATPSDAAYEAQALIILKLNNGGQANLVGQNPQFRDTGIDAVRLQKNVLLLGSSLEIASSVVHSATFSSEPQIKALASLGLLGIQGQVTVQSKGDYIAVKAVAPSASAATWLANEWARQAVSKVNSTYAAPSPNADQALQGVKAQLDQDQNALQDFLSNNQINTISQELSQTVNFIQKAGDSQTVNTLTLYDAQQRGLREQIAGNYGTISTLDQRLSEMRALRSRISEGPDDPNSLLSNQVVLLMMVNGIMSTNPQIGGAPIGMSSGNQQSGSGLQVQVSLADLGKAPLTKSNQLRDIDSTIAAVQNLQADTRTRTAQLENKLSAPATAARAGSLDSLPAEVQQYVNRRNKLESTLEKNKFELDRLQTTRDLDQKTYDLLRSRVAEQQVNQAISSIVDIGVEANVEAASKPQGMLRALALHGLEWMLVGLALGVGLAYLLNLLSPTLNTNRSLRRLLGRDRGARDPDTERTAQAGSDG